MAHLRDATDRGPTRRRVAAGLGLLVAAPLCGRARAEAAGVSDWSVTDHARVRLIDAGPHGAGRLAGLQVELDPGYLTYWRSPGEAGVPPTVTFPGATDLKAATLMFPAPGRYSEGGTEAIGYKDGVVFPLLVEPADAAKPVGLRVALHFAICERLCLPVEAAANLVLAGDGGTPEADLVRDALGRVPTQAGIGDAGRLTVLAVDGTSGDASLAVRARTEGADVPLLFAEAPDPWFVQAGEGLWSGDGTLRYPVRITGRPEDAAALPLRLTLVGIDGAVEVPATVAAPPPRP